MKKNLIISYVNKLTKQDIINYLNKENIEYTNDELDLIYNAIKNDYEVILSNDFDKYITNYKFNLNEKLYNKILEKYNEYKKFIE